MSFTMVMQLAAGLSLFLYGMKMMGEGLEKTAGDNLKKLLNVLTKNRFVGLIVGALFTMVIQSSSATTVMVVGFVNAGLMNLMQAAGVIMGANIGTTITGQLIALKLTDVAPLFMLIGVVMILFFKRVRVQRVGSIFSGFGILFLGLDLMSKALEPLRDVPEFVNIMTMFTNPVLAMLAGLGVTALIQSSSAAVGLIQALAMNELMPLETAMFLILGTAIGTCVTALLSSIGTSRDARRAAMIHLLFNIIGTVILLILLQVFPVAKWIESFSGTTVHAIANANTVFKIFMTIILFPFSSLIVKLTKIIIPGEDPKGEEKRLMFIDDRLLSTPPVAVMQLTKEVERMAQIAVDNLDRSMRCFFEINPEEMTALARNEDVIDYLNHEITGFMVKLGQLKLAPSDTRLIASYYHVVNDLERIGDHAENMGEFAQSRDDEKIPFSAESEGELRDMLENVLALCRLSLEVFHSRERARLPKVLVLEEHVDDMEKNYQQAHVDRLTQGLCTPRSGMLFSDILSNLERVADHATNIAFSVEDDNISDEAGYIHT